MGLKTYHERVAMRALEQIPGFLDDVLSVPNGRCTGQRAGA